MQAYKTKTKRLSGSGFHEIRVQAFDVYESIRKKSKRRPYIRSTYFKKDKIFIGLFWSHLFKKQNWRDRMRRMKYFPAAIELIQKTTYDPKSKENPNKRSEILHRFAGITQDDHLFYVHIKEDKKTDQKFLISVFPEY